ncbi:MAG: methyltransferase domain-containing protein [Leptolyngbya sp. SIO3F4]|nr:methyltransferase domain-containing protein [Leptolyngbya sp. SIO3F4]
MPQPNPSSTENFRTPRQEIMALLSQRIGLNINSVSNASIDRAITQAAKLSGAENDAAYLRQLKTSKLVLENLIESVVVPETNFFRNPESFDYLTKYILGLQKAGVRSKFLRVLSLPCSSGEEPYSIAMTLLEAGLLPTQFQVDGVDISHKVLATARQGIYNRYSFRNTATFSPNPYLDKYFSLTDQGSYQINDLLRSRVKFHSGNLSDAICLPNYGTYDIIFCRNLLIYFHQHARERALYNLYRLLVPNGLLFIGYAETSHIDQRQFISLCIPQAFVYRKLSHWPNQMPPPLSSPQELTSQKNKSIQSLKTITPLNSSNQPSTSFLEKPLNDLVRIRALADSGQLSVALEQCDAYLQANPMSAEAYLLLGEIYHAQGSDERADIAFHRVLYLQPDCVEALTHRLLFCEQRSDHVTANRLRQRLQRLTQNEH